MKENSLDSHRGKVAESKAVAAAIRSESTASTNFDDDYNEWELGIGDLIIDLDADIEKNNEKQGTNQGNSNNNNNNNNNSSSNNNNTSATTNTANSNTNNSSATTNSTSNSSGNATANNQLHHHHHHHHHQQQQQQPSQQQQQQQSTTTLQQPNFAMSSGKNKLNNGTGGGGGSGGTGGSGGSSVEHQATVDKGLKMKIKRTKPTKTSEAKHEIVKSDTKPNSPLEAMNGTTGGGVASGAGAVSGSSSSSSSGSAVTTGNSVVGASSAETGSNAGGGKSKHASSKGRGGSHREKKERTKDKERDKDRGGNVKSTTLDVNGVLAPPGCSITSPTIKLANSTINVASLPTPTVNLGVPANVAALGLSTASVNGAGSNGSGGGSGSTSGSGGGTGSSGANGSSGSGGNAATAIVASSGNTNTCGASGSTGSAGSGGGASATGAATGGSAAGFGASGASAIVNGGGSAPSAGVASLATAAVTPPSSISVKLEPKFPNVPISNFASIKLEDNLRGGSGIPAKRMRISVDKNAASAVDVKVERSTSPKPPEMHDMCVGTSVGTITEPECLGPCEPGTTVTLEGIVWQETEGGVLVVNVTWRGKTYVGTLLDCTKHDWAPPRFCESPTSDVESRTPKGRGKRGRGNANAATIDPSNFTETRSSMHSKLRNAGKGRRTNNSGFTAPPSPAKAPESAPTAGVKRKGRPAELELPSPTEPKSSKRSRSQSRGTPTNPTPIEPSQPSSPILIECPEPNCSKKYKHINGLRYHQTHAHHANASHPAGIEDSPDEQALKDVSSENDESTQESVPQSPGVASSSSSSEKTHRSSPRPFTGKVPPPPPTSDQKPAVPTPPATGNGGAPIAPLNITIVDGESVAGPPPPPPQQQQPSSSSTSTTTAVECVASDLGTLASVAVGDSKVGTTKGPGGSGVGVLRYGQSNNSSSTSPVGSQCQTDASASASPQGGGAGGGSGGGASSKVSSPSSSSTLPVIIPCRATSPVPATAAPLALSPAPHQSPRHTAAVSSQTVPPLQQQQQQQQQQPPPQQQPQLQTSPQQQQQQSLQPPSLGQAAQIYHHHHHHHHHNPYGHAGNEPLVAECPPGSSVVLPSQPAATIPSGGGASARSASGTPNGPVSHPLSPSIACGTAMGVVGPASPHTMSDKSKAKQEKADKYRLRVMSASPSSIPRTATPPSVAVPSPSSSSTSSKSSLTASTPPLLNLQPSLGTVPSLPIAATLKPIQPKPTLLGESPGASALVDGIKKEKSKHRRKNKERDRERKLSASYGSTLHGADLGALHAAGLDPQDKLNGSVYAKMSDLLGKDGVSRLSGAAPGSDLPLDLNTSSADNACNENVQSPAYSDISDANDTTPGLDAEVTCKDIKEDCKVKGSAEQSPTAAHNLSPYGVYPYYGQSPYVVSPMSTQSPPVSRGVAGPNSASAAAAAAAAVERSIKEEVGVADKAEEKSVKEVSKHWSERSRPVVSANERVDSQERVPANGGQMVVPTSHASSDYQLHQQKLIQQQYAYSYNYSYHYMEQAYHHHMHLKASESSYKHHHHHQQQQQQQPLQQQHHQYGADDKDRLAIAYKEQVERQKELPSRDKCLKDGIGGGKLAEDKATLGGAGSSELAKQMAAAASSQGLLSAVQAKDRDTHQQPSHHSQRSSQHGPSSSVHQPGSKVEALSASLKEKQNENHQILKENIELKTQMDKSKSNYERYEASMMYHHAQRNEELMRYLMYHEKADGPKGPEDLQRKDETMGVVAKHVDAKAQGSSKDSPKPLAVMAPTSASSRAASSPKTAAAVGGPKECGGVVVGKEAAGSAGKKDDGSGGSKGGDVGASTADANKDKKDAESRSRVQEGQKPTMETQGPPPPTNSYAYMHSPYMQPAHYGPLAYDPTHSMYRGMNPMLMTAAGHYPGPAYLHPQMRYVTAPAADPQAELANKLHPTKALDLLQHHASQYYATSHKIHELQEHAIKSPVGASSQAVSMSSTKLTDSAAVAAAAAMNKNDSMCVNNHERRSPPLQRHLHTHHHTHVGVGYPILRQYDPYGGKPLVRH